MPTYSYRCANCDYAFDQYQAFTDDSLTVCPNCGQSQLRKVFNSIGVSFTGSGFYRNDSRAENSKTASGSSSSSSSPAESSSATKSDAPAAKSEKSSSKSETQAAKSPAPKSGTVSSKSPTGPAGS
ncbi:FmdB family zinc ribbon protein [Frigoribacterium sp. UYMn621]|uniref:FmdB family zinc ribbon protein n=1 Tax=Frigoribacterium sp. UYMn621 TaxID=3156343 RepID=UPI003395C026